MLNPPKKISICLVFVKCSIKFIFKNNSTHLFVHLKITMILKIFLLNDFYCFVYVYISSFEHLKALHHYFDKLHNV